MPTAAEVQFSDLMDRLSVPLIVCVVLALTLVRFFS